MSENENPKFKVVHESKPEEPTRPRTATVFDDLAALRVKQKKSVRRRGIITGVEVDKPPSECHFRCSAEAMLDNATVVNDRQTRATYFVDPDMRDHPRLAKRLRWVTLVLTTMWPHNGFLIWPVPMLGAREFKVWTAARAAYTSALERWTQMTWSEEHSNYTVEIAEGLDHEPVWPTATFEELLAHGFENRIITDDRHPYVRQLSGILD